MKTLLSWSSGKDSAWALHLLRQDPGVELVGLLTTLNAAQDRVAMHGVRRTILHAQAQAAGLPLHVVELPWPCSNETYETLMGDFVRHSVAQGIRHIAFGDLYLEDIRRYREEKLARSGLSPIFPLWSKNTTALAREMIASGLKATVSVIDKAKLEASFAGRAFDERFLADMPAGIDRCGENGEFHTCVSAGPMFAHDLCVEPGEKVERDGFVFADIKLAD